MSHYFRPAFSVFVAFELSTTGPRALSRLAVEVSFWNPVLLHTNHVTSPTKLSRWQVCFNATDLAALEDSRVPDLIMPFDVRHLTKTTKMELIELCDNYVGDKVSRTQSHTAG